MAEELKISNLNREAKYLELLPQVKSLTQGESDLIANLANISACIKETFGFLWVGFYLVKGKELVLGPFQGPIACTRISFGKGVCGSSWKDKKILVVPDVNLFPGHIACSSKSQSEIVIPLFDEAGEVWAVLDVDSENLSDFSSIDAKYLSDMLNPI